MYDFFFAVMIVSFIVLWIGLFKPHLALSVLKAENQTRKNVLLIFGLLTIFSFSGYRLTLRREIKYYNKQIYVQLGRITDNLDTITESLKERQEEKDGWEEKFDAAIYDLQNPLETAKRLDPPMEYEKSYNIYLHAIDKLSSITENMPDAIANVDSELMKSVTQDRNEALKYLDEFVTEDFINSIK